MSLLYTFSSTQGLLRASALLTRLSPEDAVLLRGDALYQLLSAENFAAGSYGLKPDALARGLDPQQFPHIEWIDYPQWVELVAAGQTPIDW